MRILVRLRRVAAAVTFTGALIATSTVALAAPAHAAALPPIGSTLCHVSPVTGTQCGALTAINQTIYYPGGAVYGAFRYQACSGPGTQGAPIYAGGVQVGTVIGGSGNCAIGGVTFGLPLP